MSTFSRVAIRCLAIGLLLFSPAMAGNGLRHAWMFDGDGDMQVRVAEYAAFRQGIYPTRQVETEIPAGMRVPYTVYPPYALVMFVPFFEPFGKLQGRIVIELHSLVSLFTVLRVPPYVFRRVEFRRVWREPLDFKSRAVPRLQGSHGAAVRR